MTTTFGDLRAQIEAEFSEDANHDLSVEVDRAINRAIKFYEQADLWFLQTSATQSTVAGTYLYTVPSDLVRLNEITLTSNSYTYTLEPRTWSWLQRMLLDTVSINGEPSDWAAWGTQIGLYPTPDAVYTLTYWYNKRLPELESATDTNDWLTHAADLLRARAKWDLAENIINDFEGRASMANRQKAIEEFEYRNLMSKHVAVQGHYRLTPTVW